ncbi:TPA: hypothetical protein QHZ08_003012 [Enterobacter cloacae]|uniref:hypothetical protein n=1 Tax=Enterobacter TaxID=547 RepID=UPI0015B5F9BD|nr:MULTISPECIES: hypothetical protein [Enterobacter]HAS0833624.1 hypothetical protein [Enterobacter cloacae subsp. cloacae]NWJ81815.1 hypothetical protein [Enterobacter sp. SECR19-1250]QUG51275.1 hypothetical protein KDU74_21300 [Enterobacter cloacae]HDS4824247.1 hypothetical protein [Enterobacter cloacae]HDT2261975.1 hypothetical protein [Enterobacter cloacae]
MESITKQLVNIGHGMSKEIAADEPAVAKLLVELSSSLDVQYERGNALEAKCAALAAENAGLKELIKQHANSVAVCPNCSHEEPSETDDIVALYRSMETPATDAFLAEVRASELDSLAGVAETMLVKFANQGVSDTPESKGWEMILRQASQRAAQLRKGVQS